MKYLSTFSGIGGFELGIQQAYDNRPDLRNRGEVLQRDLPNTAESQDRPVCIGFSEIDKYAASIYQKHFPYEQCERCRTKNEEQRVQGAGDTEGFNSERNNISPVGLTCTCKHKNYGDITTINADELPDFDLLVGGFPCQAFSIAGKRGGFEDTRGTMFFELARILKAKQPRLFVFENVKGLLSHDGGKSFSTIIQTADELGYDCQWQVLNSKNHGVPQNRERVFIIGHLRGTSRPEVFPFGEESNEDTRRAGTEVAYCLDANYAKGTNTISKGRRQIVHVKEATKQGYAVAHEGDSINLSVPNSKTRRGRVGKGVAQTIDTGMQQHTLQNSQIRRLTPTECERLQGFPDGWTEGVSDTQRYKTLGNAVTVNVIRDIFERIL